MDRIPDPYRELGVLRGATDAQVKAAHRRLAKRFHPDAPEGDTERFLAIQEAYLLLSDPLRRRDWDSAHAPGPVRAGDPGRHRGRGAGSGGAAGGPPRARPAGRGTASGGTGGAAGSGAAGSGGSAGSGTAGAGSTGSGAGAGGRRRGASGGGSTAGDAERTGGAWSASDREPSSRSTTWSAAGVPWWEDFTPRDRSAASAPGAAGAGTAKGGAKARPAGSGAGSAGSAGAGSGASAAGGASTGRGASAGSGGAASAGGSGGSGAAPGAAGGRTTAQRSPDDVDVYSRSSGAAWSMAARRYFRKGEADLPKGGSWTYRGTQVVTGAEARKVAAEQAEERRRAAEALLRSRAPQPSGTAREAFTHDPKPASPRPTPPLDPSGSAARPASSRSTPPPPPRADPSAAAEPADVGPSLLGRVRRALGLG